MAAVAASARHHRRAFTPAVDVAQVVQPSRLWPMLWPPLRALLVFSWIAIVVSVFFQPAPNPGVTEPWLSDVIGFFSPIVLIAAVIAALNGQWRVGLGCSIAAGCMGLVMAYQCAVTLHHARAWWIYELAAFGYLTALSVGGLLVRARAGRV